MSMTPPQIRQRFEQTNGRDPLFAAFDGANCSNAKTGVAAAHSLLLSHGLIRIPLPVPADAQFSLSVVHDPYGCATFAANPRADLTHQAVDATLGHAQATQAPTSKQLNSIVNFETGLSPAQIDDRLAGKLDSGGALGGARNLVAETYYPGINAAFGYRRRPYAARRIRERPEYRARNRRTRRAGFAGVLGQRLPHALWRRSAGVLLHHRPRSKNANSLPS
jgi:hypothetical protein